MYKTGKENQLMKPVNSRDNLLANKPVLFCISDTGEDSQTTTMERKNSESVFASWETDENMNKASLVAGDRNVTGRQRHQTEPGAGETGEKPVCHFPDTEKSSSCSNIAKLPTASKDEYDGEDQIDGPGIKEKMKSAGKRLSIPFFLKSKEKKGSSMDNVSEMGGSFHKSQTFTGYFSRLKWFSRSFGKSVKKSQSSPNMKNPPEPLSFTDKIYNYASRTVGVFLLIANFTTDLKGYNTDRERIREFFEEKLGYRFIEAINCTQDAMFKAIDQARNEIRKLHQSGANPNRLIVTILTHGEENGLHTCKDAGGQLKEKNEDETLKITDLEEIIAKLKHDEENLPELRGCPKLFFIQSCFGEEIVRAAGGCPSPAVDVADGYEEEHFTYQPTLPVDTDLFVASATTKYNRAFVSTQEGSWFIKSMLAVFRKHYKSKDVEAMFKAVTFDVSEIRKAFRLEDGSEVVAAQVPIRQSTLRKNCFL